MAEKQHKQKHKKNISIKADSGSFRLHLILILIAVLAAFSAAVNNGITNWDDSVYLIDNASIKKLSWENIKAIFTSTIASNYHPITILSYAIEYHFFKLNPVVYHLVNVLIHFFNAYLVYKLIRLFINNNMVALIASLLFAVHPMHVESVAWISERKDVLYTCFFLLSLITYIRYAHSTEEKSKLYAYSLLFYLLSLLSKGMAVVLPLIMLLTDYFFERKFTLKTITEKIPFFILSLVFGLIAVYAQKTTQAMDLKTGYSFAERFLLGSYSFSLYIYKLMLPINLSAFYPYPFKPGDTIPFSVYASLAVLTAFVAGMIIAWKKNNKVIFTGLSFFIITIILVLQFIPVGNAVMAERYSYVPYIGLFFIIAVYINKWQSNKRNSQAALISLAIVFLVMIFISRERCKIWKDSETLWSDVIEKYPEADIAYLNRGIYIVLLGKEQQANDDFTKAIELNPNYTEAYNNRGLLRQNKNDLQGSIEDFNEAIKTNTAYVEAYSNRAISYLYQKKYTEAINDFDKTLELSPEYANVYSNRGNLYIDIGEKEKGVTDLLKAKQFYLQQGDKAGAQRITQRLNQLGY